MRGRMGGKRFMYELFKGGGLKMFRWLGTINVELDESQWASLIKSRSELKATDAIEYINPFTKQPSTITVPKELANVFVDGNKIGAVRWCRHDGGELSIFGEANAVSTFAQELAAELNAQFDSR
jgi:hypothetical protein